MLFSVFSSFVFLIILQVLDVATTLVGLNLGAGESSRFLRVLMQLSPLMALLVGKAIGVAIAVAARTLRRRLIPVINVWTLVIVIWNVAIIWRLS